MSKFDFVMNVFGVLVLELVGGEIFCQVVFSVEQVGELVECVGCDLVKLVLQVVELDLVFVVVYFDLVEVLCLGWLIYCCLEELQMCVLGCNQGLCLLVFGIDVEGDVLLLFQVDVMLVGGGLCVVLFLLIGSDVVIINVVVDVLEEILLVNGMVYVDIVLMVQNIFGVCIEYVCYFIVNDLVVMMLMQYDNQGLVVLWLLIEIVIMVLGEDEWFNVVFELLLCYMYGEVCMVLFDLVGWCVYYSYSKNDCDCLQGIYEQFLMCQ